MKRKSLSYCVLAFFYALFTVLGRQVEKSGNADFYSLWTYAALLGCFCAFFFMLLWLDRLLQLVRKKREKGKKPAFKAGKRLFFVTWGGLGLSYFVALLAAFPGFFCYDATVEVYEVLTYKYSNHHPIVHELLLGEILRLGNRFFGSFNAGITIYVTLQVIALSAVFAYLLYVLARHGMSKAGYVVSALFLAFFPTIGMFAVCTAKDVPFTAGVVLFTAVLYDAAGEADQGMDFKNTVLAFAAACMILFFRNNGIYVLVATGIICLIFRKGRKGKIRWTVPILLAIVFYLIVTESLIALLPAKRGELKETLSVPMQQLARTYKEKGDEMPKEDREILFELIPESILKNYNPKCADDVKVNFLEDNFKSNLPKYASFYFKYLMKYPGVYVNAFLDVSDGYYYPWAVITGYQGRKIVEMIYGESAYFQFQIEDPGVPKPVLKGLNRFYESLSLDVKWQRYPVIGRLLSPATYFWIFLLAFTVVIAEKRRDEWLVFLIAMLNFGVMLLGPMALVRYALHFYVLMPMMVRMILEPKKTAFPSS